MLGGLSAKITNIWLGIPASARTVHILKLRLSTPIGWDCLAVSYCHRQLELDPAPGMAGVAFKLLSTHQTDWQASEAKVTLSARCDARIVPSSSSPGGARVAYSHIAVLDGFFDEPTRLQLLEQLTEAGWDHAQVIGRFSFAFNVLHLELAAAGRGGQSCKALQLSEAACLYYICGS